MTTAEARASPAGQKVLPDAFPFLCGTVRPHKTGVFYKPGNIRKPFKMAIEGQEPQRLKIDGKGGVFLSRWKTLTALRGLPRL